MASLNFYVPNQTPNLVSKPTTKHSSISLPTCLFCKPTTKHSSISGVHYYNKAKRNQGVTRASSETMTTVEKLGIKIVKNPPEEKLTGLGVRSWPKWGCPPSKFPWTYSSKETCFLLKGKVKVYPEGSDQAVEFGAGDLVEFPSGMSCTWDVSETVDKHYKFE